MNNLNKAAAFEEAMGKLAGLFWKKLDKPVGIKAIWGNEDDPADSDDLTDFNRPTAHARLGAYRTMEPRLLTRLFSSPSKDYKNMLAGMQSVVDRDPDAPPYLRMGLESPIGRAIWASHALPSMLADRYSFGTDAPLGNEDVFEDTRTPYYKGLQGHMKSHGMPFPEAWKQITHPEILNPKVKGGGIKIEDIKMDKSAGLFWKKLDKPVGIKSLFGPDDGATSMRLDAERTMSPRLLTRLFSSPRKDYDHMFSAIKLNEEYGEDRDSPGNQALATPEGRAMLASYMLPRWYPDRYKQEGDSPIGGEDIFENAVYRAKPVLKKAASFGAMMGKMAFFKKSEGPLSAGPRPSVPEGVYKPKLPNFGSNSILYTPGMEAFPAPADYGPPRERHSAPTAPPGEPRNQLNYAPTPKPWQPPKPGPYDEQQAQASRSKQLEDENNFANPLGWRIPDPVSFKDHVGQFLGTTDPKGKVNLYSPLESKGWPIPPSQARPELPFGDSYRYKHLARPPFTMPTTPTSDLQ